MGNVRCRSSFVGAGLPTFNLGESQPQPAWTRTAAQQQPECHLAGAGLSLSGGIGVSVDGTLRVADSSCCAGAHGAVIQVDQNLPNGSNQFLISDGQKFGQVITLTVVPQVSISGAPTVTEATGGTIPATFTVTRAPWSALSLPVPFTTANGSGRASRTSRRPVAPSPSRPARPARR